MVSNTTRLSALLFAHVFEKYVDFVEDGNLLDLFLPRYFPTFEIDVFFEHVCKMHVIWLLHRHTCSRNTTNVLPGCPYFAHAFEKGAKFAAGVLSEADQMWPLWDTTGLNGSQRDSTGGKVETLPERQAGMVDFSACPGYSVFFEEK